MAYKPIGSGATQQATWYIDPVAGSDNNDGATAVAALKTWRRFQGLVSATLIVMASSPATLTIHWLSDQPDDTDPVTPLMYLSNVNLVMDGVLIQQDTSTFGAVTNVVRSPAQLTTAITAKVGAPANYWTAFVDSLVHDVTLDTWMRVDADLGAQKAQFSQPFVGVPLSPLVGANAQGTIALGNAYVVYRFPRIYVSNAMVQGNAPTYQTSFFTHLEFIVPPGSLTAMGFTNLGSQNITMFQECTWTNAAPFLSALPEQIYFYNCAFPAGVVVSGGSFLGGTIRSFATFSGPCVLDGDVLLQGPIEIWQFAAFCKVYANVVLDVPFNTLSFPNFGILNISNSLGAYPGTSQVWGPGGIAVHSNGRVFYDGTAVNQILLTGALTIEGAATGAKMVPGAPRVITDAIAITPANIDDVAGGRVVGMLGSQSESGAGFFKFA